MYVSVFPDALRSDGDPTFYEMFYRGRQRMQNKYLDQMFDLYCEVRLLVFVKPRSTTMRRRACCRLCRSSFAASFRLLLCGFSRVYVSCV